MIGKGISEPTGGKNMNKLIMPMCALSRNHTTFQNCNPTDGELWLSQSEREPHFWLMFGIGYSFLPYRLAKARYHEMITHDRYFHGAWR